MSTSPPGWCASRTRNGGRTVSGGFGRVQSPARGVERLGASGSRRPRGTPRRPPRRRRACPARVAAAPRRACRRPARRAARPTPRSSGPAAGRRAAWRPSRAPPTRSRACRRGRPGGRARPSGASWTIPTRLCTSVRGNGVARAAPLALHERRRMVDVGLEAVVVDRRRAGCRWARSRAARPCPRGRSGRRGCRDGSGRSRRGAPAAPRDRRSSEARPGRRRLPAAFSAASSRVCSVADLVVGGHAKRIGG